MLWMELNNMKFYNGMANIDPANFRNLRLQFFFKLRVQKIIT